MSFGIGTELEYAVAEVYRPLATVADDIYNSLVILLFGGRSKAICPQRPPKKRNEILRLKKAGSDAESHVARHGNARRCRGGGGRLLRFSISRTEARGLAGRDLRRYDRLKVRVEAAKIVYRDRSG